MITWVSLRSLGNHFLGWHSRFFGSGFSPSQESRNDRELGAGTLPGAVVCDDGQSAPDAGSECGGERLGRGLSGCFSTQHAQCDPGLWQVGIGIRVVLDHRGKLWQVLEHNCLAATVSFMVHLPLSILGAAQKFLAFFRVNSKFCADSELSRHIFEKASLHNDVSLQCLCH